MLTVGAILASGPRTVLRVLSTLGSLAPGHHTDYHRLFSRAPWSTWKLGKLIARRVIDLVPPRELGVVPMDDVAVSKLRTTKVAWYGASERTVQIASGCGHWYRAGERLVPVPARFTDTNPYAPSRFCDSL